MKHFFLTGFFIFASLVNILLAQEFQTGQVEYNGVVYPAYVKDMNASVDQAETAVMEIFSSRGVKPPKKSKGFLIYREVVLPATGDPSLKDLFVKVERIGKKNEDKSRVYLIITKPGAISESKPAKGEKSAPIGFALAVGGDNVFQSLTPAVENQVYLKSLLDQEGQVRIAEKRLQDLQSKQGKLEKQLKDLQDNIKSNNAEIENQVKQIAAEKTELERRKNAKPEKSNES